MYRVSPARKAILIGSSHKGDGYAIGVDNDIANFKKFLFSERGGYWFEEEIIVLDEQPTLLEVASAVQNNIADYQLVFFAGHGCQNGDDRYIKLSDVSVPDTFLLSQSLRQLIIVDACRNKDFAAISGIPEERKWKNLTGKDKIPEARYTFDRFILNSRPGKIILHSTQAGCYAQGSVNGGLFTSHLLYNAKSVKKTVPHTPIFLAELLPPVISQLRWTPYKQIPEIVYVEGNMNIPFALSTKNSLVYSTKHQELKKIKLRRVAGNNIQRDLAIPCLVGIGLLLVVLNSD